MRTRYLAALAIAGLLATGLAGCGNLASATGATASSGNPVAASTVDDRAWATALVTYVAVTDAYTAAVTNGTIDKATVAKIAPLRKQAVAIRKAAQAAYEAANATDLAAQMAALASVLAQIKPLVPGA